MLSAHPYADHYTFCHTLEDWIRCLRESALARVVAEDYETRPSPHRLPHDKSALRPEQGALICGISLAWRGYAGQLRSCYAAIRHHSCHSPNQLNPESVLDAYRDWCRDRPADHLRLVHNLAMEDAQNLRERIPWCLPGQRADTMVAYRVANMGVGARQRVGLKPLRNKYFKDVYSGGKNQLDGWLKARGLKPGRDIWITPAEMAGVYGAGDTCSSLELWEQIKALVYAPPTQWWMSRGHFDLKDPPLTDLYELEIEAALEAVLMCQGGDHFDVPTATSLHHAATMMQRGADAWLLDHISKILSDDDLAFCTGGEQFDAARLNFGSGPQTQRLLFGDGAERTGLGFTPDIRYMSQKFNMMGTDKQNQVLQDPGEVIRYTSTGAAALREYAQQVPEHADLLLMLAARRKMSTVSLWAHKVPTRFMMRCVLDPWYGNERGPTTDRIFHRLNTVLTLPGRMSSSEYNGQNVVADIALQLASRVGELLKEFLTSQEWEKLRAACVPVCPNMQDFGVRRLWLTEPGCHGRAWDLSQIEVRIFAGLTRNKKLCDGYGSELSPEIVAHELKMLQNLGDGLSISEYLRATQVDTLRHWAAAPIDAHSMVTGMTLRDDYVSRTRMSRDQLNHVLQCLSRGEDIAVSAVLEAWKNADAAAASELVHSLKRARKSRKAITFGIMYGMGKQKLARSLGMTFEEAKAFLAEQYFAEFPEARTLPWDIEKRIVARANRDNGWVGWMKNPTGRHFEFRVVWGHYPSDPPCRSVGKSIGSARPCSACHKQAVGGYVAVNRFIQGYAAGVYKVGLVRQAALTRLPAFGGGAIHPVTRRAESVVRLRRSIHDETVVSVPVELDNALMDYVMRSAMTLFTKIGVRLETSSERYRVHAGEKEEVHFTTLE